MKIHAYIHFDGTCEAAFAFYADLFDAVVQPLMRYGDNAEMAALSPGFEHRVLHACLMRDGEALLMGSDAGPGHPVGKIAGASVALLVDDVTHAEELFAALANGGTITMPIQPTFWSTRFGMVSDRFGTPWMINCVQADGSQGEGAGA